MESRDPFFEVSVSGLVSVSKDFDLGLELFVSTLCKGYFLWSFAREFLKKTVLKNDCSKFSRSKRPVAKLFLLLCCLQDGENNLLSTPFKIYTEFNKKCACTSDTAARNLNNERLGSTFLRTIFELFFQEFCTETYRLIQKRWKSAKKFLFWEVKWKHVFFAKCFSKHCVKTRWWSFFFLSNADFFKFKNASELSWGKVSLIRVVYRDQIMHHGWSGTFG